MDLTVWYFTFITEYCILVNIITPYISELTPGTNRSLVSFTSLVISSDNVNRGLAFFTMSASLVTIKSLVCKLILRNRRPGF